MSDRDQLQMVFRNIVLNAAQAMHGKGVLSLEMKPALNEDGGTVEIRISDTGPGIPPENMEKIFQPLFTTRSRGIGLGLPIVKMIVEKHNGDIAVEPGDGTGASFIIRLPIMQKKG
jgi:signal transduction histidine kinase